MSAKPRTVSGIVVSAIMTAIVIAACWYIWTETPDLLRKTPLRPYRHLVSLLAIFLVLSLLNPVFAKLWTMFSSKKND